MANDNDEGQATAEEIERVFVGKAYEKLLGRWVTDPDNGEVLLIKSVNLSQGNGRGFKAELTFMTPDEVIRVVNMRDTDAQEDAFFGNNFSYDIDRVTDIGINMSIDAKTPVKLEFCNPPTGLANIQLSDELRAFLEPGILGTIETRDMGLTGYGAGRTPITGIFLGSFDGERFDLRVVCAGSYSHTPDGIYDVTGGEIFTKRDPGAPERAPGRVLPLRRPSQDT